MPKEKQPPTFPFYAADFIASTLSMDAETVGVYIRLLAHQWLNYFIPNDLAQIARIGGVSAKKLGHIWKNLSPKWKEIEQGKLINERLAKIREEKDQFIENSRVAGIKSAEKRWKNGNQPYNRPYNQPYNQNVTLQSSSSFKEKYIKENPETKTEQPTQDAYPVLRKQLQDYFKNNPWEKFAKDCRFSGQKIDFLIEIDKAVSYLAVKFPELNPENFTEQRLVSEFRLFLIRGNGFKNQVASPKKEVYKPVKKWEEPQ